MDSAARVDQVKVAAYTRWPQSQRWPVRAARRERFSAEPPDQPTEELLVITDALQPDRWRIRHGSSHAAKGCGIAVASPATGLTAAFAWLSSGAAPSKRSLRRRLCAFGASFPRRPSLPTQGACLGLVELQITLLAPTRPDCSSHESEENLGTCLIRSPD